MSSSVSPRAMTLNKSSRRKAASANPFLSILAVALMLVTFFYVEDLLFRSKYPESSIMLVGLSLMPTASERARPEDTRDDAVRRKFQSMARRRSHEHPYGPPGNVSRVQLKKKLRKIKERSKTTASTSDVTISTPKKARRTSKDLFPDINIVGFPKSGTSNLYSIIAQHPEAQPFATSKERCLHKVSRFDDYDELYERGDKNAISESLIQIYSRGVIRKNNTLLSVNGCMDYGDLFRLIDYVRPPPTKKFILLFRDPAEWLWASFNFWYFPDMDLEPAESYNWASADRHYRSPELFHELIVSGGRLRTANRLLRLREETIVFPRQLIAKVGRENVLLIRSEEMLPSVIDEQGGFLDQLSNFTGLGRDLYDPKYTGAITNCNDAKMGKCGKDSAPSGGYEITEGREMFQTTRELIYLHFWEECKLWAQDFGIYYHRCLNVLKDEKIIDDQIA